MRHRALIDTVATDGQLTEEQELILMTIGESTDTHPDAHACRLKLSCALLHSKWKHAWSITSEMAAYVAKQSTVSSECALTRSEELLIFKSDDCVSDPDHPKLRSGKISLSQEEVVRLHNRRQMLRNGGAPRLIEYSKRSEDVSAFLNLERPANWDWNRTWHDNVHAPDAMQPVSYTHLTLPTKA